MKKKAIVACFKILVVHRVDFRPEFEPDESQMLVIFVLTSGHSETSQKETFQSGNSETGYLWWSV